MKTEKEFSDFFASTLLLKAGPMTATHAEVEKLSLVYWVDLTSHLCFYFSNEDRWRITEKAASELAMRIKNAPFKVAWHEVIRSFNENHYWNFEGQDKKEKTGLTEDQKIFRKLFKYIWAFVQSMLVLKIAVYYFGLESAKDTSSSNSIWLWIFFSISTLSLTFFAYRNRHDEG